MPVITIDYLPTRGLCRISGDFFTEVREHFSVKNEGAFFARKKGMRFVKDRSYFITPTGMFETGLLLEIVKYCKGVFTNVEFKISPDALQAATPTLAGLEVFDELSLKLRDFQLETVKKTISRGRGIIKIGTGGGKTLTIASILSSAFIKNKNMLCLLLVPDLSLVKQTFDDFTSYDVPFSYSKWTGSNDLEIGNNVIIANMGIVQSRYEENEWIQNVDMFIVDECFRGDTKISTLNGDINICDIKVGDIVLSYNIKKNMQEYKPVVQLYKNNFTSTSYDYFIRIELVDGKYVECTPNHKIYTSRGMVEAQHIQDTDDIIII